VNGLTIKDITLTNDAAADLLTTALEAGHTHGFGYWGNADRVRWKGNKVTSMIITENEAYGYGHDVPRMFKVDYLKVQAALLLILADGGVACECSGFVDQILTSDIDGACAEAVIQVMCFGKVIYG